MKKTQKKMMVNLLISAVVLIVIAAAYFLFVLPTEKNKEDFGKLIISDQWNFDEEDIVGIHIDYLEEDGLVYTTLLNKDTETGMWEMIVPINVSADAKIMERMMEALLELDTEKAITNLAEDSYAEYGFDNPTHVIDLIMSSGTNFRIITGMLAPTENLYYTLLDNDSNTVYITYAYKFTGLNKIPSEIADREVFKEEEFPIPSITNLRISTLSGDIFQFTKVSNEHGMVWALNKPYQIDLDDYAVKRHVLKLYTVDFSDYVEMDRDPFLLEVYGLDNPSYFVEIFTDTGESNTLYLSGMETSNFIYAYSSSKPGIGRIYSSDVESLFDIAVTNFLPIAGDE